MQPPRMTRQMPRTLTLTPSLPTKVRRPLTLQHLRRRPSRHPRLRPRIRKPRLLRPMATVRLRLVQSVKSVSSTSSAN